MSPGFNSFWKNPETMTMSMSELTRSCVIGWASWAADSEIEHRRQDAYQGMPLLSAPGKRRKSKQEWAQGEAEL